MFTLIHSAFMVHTVQNTSFLDLSSHKVVEKFITGYFNEQVLLLLVKLRNGTGDSGWV